MFPANGTVEPANGIVRIGDTVVESRTIVVGSREYTAYVWGKRMPRTNEAQVRQAAQDLDLKRAQLGETPPLAALIQLREALRSGLAAADAGTPAETVLADLRTSFQALDQVAALVQAPLPMWQEYLNRVMCGLVEGLSPLQADLFTQAEVRQILETCHYPGFWRDPEAPLPNGPAPTIPAVSPTMTTTTTSSTSSTSKPELPVSAESASPSSDT